MFASKYFMKYNETLSLLKVRLQEYSNVVRYVLKKIDIVNSVHFVSTGQYCTCFCLPRVELIPHLTSPQPTSCLPSQCFAVIHILSIFIWHLNHTCQLYLLTVSPDQWACRLLHMQRGCWNFYCWLYRLSQQNMCQPDFRVCSFKHFVSKKQSVYEVTTDLQVFEMLCCLPYGRAARHLITFLF